MKIISVVVDELPENCEQCDFISEHIPDTMYAWRCWIWLAMMGTNNHIVNPEISRLPDCPLQPLREKNDNSTGEEE